MLFVKQLRNSLTKNYRDENRTVYGGPCSSCSRIVAFGMEAVSSSKRMWMFMSITGLATIDAINNVA